VTASFAGEGLVGTRVDPETPVISLVIPTFNESANIGELLDRLTSALPAEAPCEVIFVDDSTDDTPAVITEAARRSRLAVSVYHRELPEGGLGGAVALGLRQASAPWIVVMDADLQHPPTLVPDLVTAGRRAEADLVVATRYAGGGSRAGLDGGFRKFASGGSTALGYKILLELVVRCRLRQVTEVPYQFQDRFAGESKANFGEGLRFLRHLLVLRVSSVTSLLTRLARPGRRTTPCPAQENQ
jgi:dolichol-phosphate mannosyltransferase